MTIEKNGKTYKVAEKREIVDGIHIKRLQRNGNGENIKIRLPYFRRRKSVYRRKRLILTEVQNGTE